MTWVAVAVINAGASLIGSGMQANAAESAGERQLEASRYAAEQQREMFDIINKQQEPYRAAGYQSLSRIRELLPALTKPVTREEILGLPGYQAAIEQGTGAARQTMNVGGGGSNVDRAAQKFALDYTLTQAMPQVISQRQNIYNTLAGIAGIGQTAQGQVSTMGQNVATNIGQAAIGGATAYGAGQIGAANAYAGGLNNMGNTAFMYSLMTDPRFRKG
jgi:hypothetical protein